MNGENGTIKPIPYGISDYGLIREKNYYYVDKTCFIENLENSGRYLFFIRPRRFGKSLFISLLEAYYDVLHEKRFEELFNGTWIYDHPTDEKGLYLALSFNFSVVDPEPGKTEISFLDHVRGTAVEFIQKYRTYLSANPEIDYFSQTIKESGSASDILSNLFLLAKEAHRKIYVFIDEYDNFANTILSTVGKTAYKDLTRGPGFFRSFFNVLKKGTSGMDAPVSRSFITGVSPITMDDVTSGYNIGENVSLDGAFNRMLGFTASDVTTMLKDYRGWGLIKDEPGLLMDIIDQWYGNYRFSKRADDSGRLYNSDMVLYFLKEYFKTQSIPDDLVDRNVRIDYGKLRHLIIIEKNNKATINGNFGRLREIVEKGETTAKLQKGFPLEKLVDENNFTSLLFYFGLLTISREELNEQVMEIPNETIRRLYYDYIAEGYEETEIFTLNFAKYSRLMKRMALAGEWKPLLDYLTGLMRESMGVRELIKGEKSIQAFLAVYLGLSELYVLHSEKEMNKGFADIVMEPFMARFEEIKYSYIFEIKYLKTGKKQDKSLIQQIKEEGKKQLASYSLDGKFRQNIMKTRLIKVLLIFSGHEAIYMGVEGVGR